MKDEDKFVRRLGIAFVFVNVALLLYVLAFPVQDLLYKFTVADGSTAYTAYSFAWWILFLFVIFNFAAPVMLMGAITAYDSAVRIDLHSMTTVFAIVINAFVALVLIFVYLAWTNTSYSGGFPFNDYRWCCVYYLARPELCANTAPCVPAVTNDMLSVNREFTMLWIFSGVLLLVTILHLGVNKLLRDSGAVGEASEARVEEGKLMGIITVFVYVAVFCYYFAWPVLDTLYVNGYPVFAVPPSPGPYLSNLYGVQWTFVYFGVLNIIPPFVFMVALVWRKSYALTSADYWFTIAVSLFSIASFIVFLGILIFGCNVSWSGGSICNSDLWCCKYFDSAPTLCANVGPCPSDTPGLLPNAQFQQHLVFSLIFSVLGLVKIWLNFRMRRYGVFQYY
jgi:hypothetical protein